MPATTPADFLALKTPTATALGAAEIREKWSQRLREQAFFSARMTLQGYLERMKGILVEVAEDKLDESAARLALRRELATLGYIPPEPGLKDASSTQRLNLILKTNRQTATSLAQIARSENPIMLLRFPAWHLVSGGYRRRHRTDWAARWKAAGDAVGWAGASKQTMAALKTSPIWQALGEGVGGFHDTLGNPYPPFAFGSSYEWDELSITEAQDLGLLPKAETAPVRNRRECRAQNPATCRTHGACESAQKASVHPAIGKSGDWKTLGLTPGREIKGDPPENPLFAEEARDIIRRGDTVKNPLGDTLTIDERTYKHINKKGRSQEEVLVRLREYPQMKACIEHPHEIWLDEKNGRRKYVQFLEVDGGKGINAVDEDKNHVLSWHSNRRRLDYYRKGKLLYVRQKPRGE